MKALPKQSGTPRKRAPTATAPKRPGARRRVKVDWAAERAHALGGERKQKKRRKPRNSLAYRVMDELWDGIEDIFD
jgi:hypothetical protein